MSDKHHLSISVIAGSTDSKIARIRIGADIRSSLNAYVSTEDLMLAITGRVVPTYPTLDKAEAARASKTGETA